jgi:hypothetical protein
MAGKTVTNRSSHGVDYEDGCLLGCSAILMMEAVRTSETSVNSYRSTWRYNPEDSRLQVRPLMTLYFILPYTDELSVFVAKYCSDLAEKPGH